MSRPFSGAIAEHVVAVTQAVATANAPVDATFVADFADLQPASAQGALDLAVDLGLLTKNGATYEVKSPLCRFTQSPEAAPKMALLRVLLEDYEPFRVFRSRLAATADASTAAEQTRVLLDLDAHRDEILQTLISLGTFAQALVTTGGGHHRAADDAVGSALVTLAQSASELASAEAEVLGQLGRDAYDACTYAEVIQPLCEALVKANEGDARGAVTNAGNAVESYLAELAGRQGVNVVGAHGVTAKVNRLSDANWMPGKLKAVGTYLGNIRNAADHGIDPDINASWNFAPHTGVEYVFVALGFVRACDGVERGGPPIL